MTDMMIHVCYGPGEPTALETQGRHDHGVRHGVCCCCCCLGMCKQGTARIKCRCGEPMLYNKPIGKRFDCGSCGRHFTFGEGPRKWSKPTTKAKKAKIA